MKKSHDLLVEAKRWPGSRNEVSQRFDENAMSSLAETRLADGRTLACQQYGPRGGPVLFYFHGYPGSRLEAGLLANGAVRLGVRVIGVDRPGIGRSTLKPHRRLLDWPDDVVALADDLDVDRFAVIGFSGGGPYALACAHAIPERMTGCAVVSGPGPVSGWRFVVSRVLPWLVTPLVRRRFVDEERTTLALRRLARRWPRADRSILARPGVGDTLVASLVEAFRQGSRGPAIEAMILGGPWGFELEDVSFPGVHVWHGRRDSQVPLRTAQGLLRSLRAPVEHHSSDDGHMSLIVNRAPEIMEALIQGSSSQGSRDWRSADS